MTFAPDMQGAAPADTQSLRSSGDGTDDGQIMLLSIVYGLIALGLVLVVATVSTYTSSVSDCGAWPTPWQPEPRMPVIWTPGTEAAVPMAWCSLMPAWLRR